MVRAYLDTSVLVALLTDDPSTPRADAFFRTHAPLPIVSDFAAAEFASALARRVRMGEIDAGQAQDALTTLDLWIERVAYRVELSPSDIAGRNDVPAPPGPDVAHAGRFEPGHLPSIVGGACHLRHQDGERGANAGHRGRRGGWDDGLKHRHRTA